MRGRAEGEISGGPAGHGRNPEGEDATGNANWVEQLADGINNYSTTCRHDSEQTLTEDYNDDDDDEAERVPNYWFSVRRRVREPLAEYVLFLRILDPASIDRWAGTMVAVLISVSGNLQVKTSQGQAGSFSQEAATWGLGE